MANRGKVEAVTDFLFLSSKITADGDCSHEIRRQLLLGIRRFSSREGMEASRQAATQQNWDYRWQQVPKKGESGRT